MYNYLFASVGFLLFIFKQHWNFSSIHYQDIGMSMFNKYINLITYIKTHTNTLYKNNVFMHNSMNLLHYSYAYLHSYMNNYLIEPCEQNWYNRVIIYDKHYNLDGSFSDFALIEDYNTISYNTNQNMMKKVIEFALRKYNNSLSTPSCINLKELYIIKFYDYYIYKLCSKSLSESILNIKPVSNPFFSITYTDNKYFFSIDLDLPKSLFISGNQILSCAFIKRWFDYSIMDSIFQFHTHYIIEMTDDNFEDVSIDSNKYILLTDDGYTIKNC